jgi:hypothetical protein
MTSAGVLETPAPGTLLTDVLVESKARFVSKLSPPTYLEERPLSARLGQYLASDQGRLS